MNYHCPKYYIDHDAPCVTLHVSHMDDVFSEIAISMDARLLQSLQEIEQLRSIDGHLSCQHQRPFP